MSDNHQIAPPHVSVRIDRLRIRLNGLEENAARAALAGLGPQLARCFTAQEGNLATLTAHHADLVRVPPLRHDGRDSESLRSATAQAIATAIHTLPGNRGGTP